MKVKEVMVYYLEPKLLIVCVWSRVPQRSGSHERMECCFPVFPDGPPLPHSATSVPILQRSGSNTGNKHRVRLTLFAISIGSLHFFS